MVGMPPFLLNLTRSETAPSVSGSEGERQRAAHDRSGEERLKAGDLRSRTDRRPRERGMIRWMIDAGHLDDDNDPTIGLKSGKAKASRETGGFLPWTESDMALYRAKWPLGTEARLMFDILHYTFLRLGDAIASGRLICGKSCARWRCRSRPKRAAATPL
jgi:hypothetical protein